MSAAAFWAVEACVYGLGIFGAGLDPVGAGLPWTLRLVSIAVGIPLLGMAVTGAAGGALWLRFRAPSAEGRALGLLGSPFVALPVAAGFMVAAAAGQRWLPVGAWLAELALLTGAALIGCASRSG